MRKRTNQMMPSLFERLLVSTILVTISFIYMESHLLFGKFALPIAGAFCLQIFLL